MKTMNCKFCKYEWATRVDKPKSCPNCKRRFLHPKRVVFTGITIDLTGAAIEELANGEAKARMDGCEDIEQVRIFTDKEAVNMSYSELLQRLGIL